MAANKYVCTRNSQKEMCAAWRRRVLLPGESLFEYAPRALLKLENKCDGRTDGRTPDRYITLTARRGQRYK